MAGDKTKLISTLPMGVTTHAFQDQLHDLEASTIIELFEVNAMKYGLGVYRFHPGKVLNGDLIYDNKTYKSLPFEIDEMETKGDGTLPRPKIRIANVDGFISDIINGRDDFVGLHFTRKRIFLKYLDAGNFHNSENPFGDPDINARFPDDKFIINQKLSEDKNLVEFEIVSILEMETVRIPSRQVISNYCNWVYRGIGCNYGSDLVHPRKRFESETSAQARGLPIADARDKLFSHPSASGGYGFIDAAAINVAWNTFEEFEEDGAISQRANSEIFHDSGNYNSTGIYLSGDTVFIQGVDNAETDSFRTDSNIELHFIAKPTGKYVTEIQGVAFSPYNVSGSDPRSDKQNWAQDQCSKTISGCALRFKTCGGGLPFGGFPGTDKFGYV